MPIWHLFGQFGHLGVDALFPMPFLEEMKFVESINVEFYLFFKQYKGSILKIDSKPILLMDHVSLWWIF